MKVFVNSNITDLPDEVDTVGKLLVHLNVPESGTGVGINGKIIQSRNRENTYLHEGDNIIIISAAYGG